MTADAAAAAHAQARPGADSRTAHEQRLVLAGSCTVKDAAALKRTLCLKAREMSPVTVDVGSVERIDTAALQLLCAFVRERAARGLEVTWHGDSAPFNEAVRLLGVGRLLAVAGAKARDNSEVPA